MLLFWVANFNFILFIYIFISLGIADASRERMDVLMKKILQQPEVFSCFKTKKMLFFIDSLGFKPDLFLISVFVRLKFSCKLLTYCFPHVISFCFFFGLQVVRVNAIDTVTIIGNHLFLSLRSTHKGNLIPVGSIAGPR